MGDDMIHFVKGVLDTVGENQIVVENQGIGFEIMVPMSVVSALPQTGNEVKIYTYMYVREDCQQLFGFLTKDELAMFKLLITVSGIGPKGALGILSVMDADALRFAVLADDAGRIRWTLGKRWKAFWKEERLAAPREQLFPATADRR